MKPLIVVFTLSTTFPGEAPKRFEQVISGPDAVAACTAMAAAMFKSAEKSTADGRIETVECRASR